MSKRLLYHPFYKDKSVRVPRIAPSRSKLQPVVTSIEKELGVQSSENGKLAFKSLTVVVQELLARDPGTMKMPPLLDFADGKRRLPIVISFDATGFGRRQLNTAVVRNPFMSSSAHMLYPFGLGCCGDDRSGTLALFGPNLGVMNELILADEADQCVTVDVEGVGAMQIKPEIYCTTDVAALRHCEHLAASGWCMCPRDTALRTVPKRPATPAKMHEQLKQCKAPCRVERFVLSHNIVPGEELPRPCPAPGCTFAHVLLTTQTLRCRSTPLCCRRRRN